ncbi:hypothetical protein Dimus_032795 [Dionaea muscipula]
MATSATQSHLSVPLKLTLISTAVLFSAVLISFLLPQLLVTASSDLPLLWSSLRSWLRPPYLYFVINGIIITIAASSRLHHHRSNNNNHNVDEVDIHHHYHVSPDINFSLKAPPAYDALGHVPAHDPYQFDDYGAVSAKDVDVVGETPGFGGVILREEGSVDEMVPVMLKAVMDDAEEEVKIRDLDLDLTAEKSLCMIPVRQDSLDVPSENWLPSTAEKPSVTSRFAHYRRPARSGPEGGKVLRVTKPRSKETLEGTWKAITEGRHMPLTRHLKKSDTWQIQSSQLVNPPHADAPPRMAKKSETFKDGTGGRYSAASVAPRPSVGVRLRKEPSLGQDELNRRVEAFINKFNEEMRLQRQQSLQQYMEMINRGA